MENACHTPRGGNGKVYAAGFIYAMNLRNGLLRPLCCITNGTQRHHELPILRKHIDDQNNQCSQLENNLTVYDKVVTDFSWWAKQKARKNYMISVLKENSVAIWIESIAFDANNPISTGIEDYRIYESQGVRFNIIDYRDPETQKLHRFVSTLPESINPGTIAILYYKRWSI